MIQPDGPALVLASQSRSRRELVLAAGVAFTTQPAHIDEDGVKRAARAEGAGVADVAILLAELKAARLSSRVADAVVIGAEQILVCDGVWFDKPASRADAAAQLVAMRGTTVRLWSAAVLAERLDALLVAGELPDVTRLREEFETVKYVKPASSRKDSAEVFLVALNKR